MQEHRTFRDIIDKDSDSSFERPSKVWCKASSFEEDAIARRATPTVGAHGELRMTHMIGWTREARPVVWRAPDAILRLPLAAVVLSRVGILWASVPRLCVNARVGLPSML